MGRVEQVPPHHIDELGVALGGPDRGGVAGRPQQKAGNPEPEAQRDRRRERAVGDGDGPRRAAEQDRVAERPMHRRIEAGDVVRGLAHPITAPPPKEKKLRKNELAANAIDSPNTIWIRRRKPPEVSPKASDRPVVMMMITAMILETGPCTESRICCSGCSHGMFEPAA